MFDIEYKGGNSVVISTKDTTVVIDPKRSVVGLKDMTYKEGVQLATESRFAVDDSSFRVSLEGPGEYEVGDISIRGIAAARHIDSDDSIKASTIYGIKINEIKVVVLGNIDPKLSEEQLENIGMVDAIIIPVGGGGYTLDATGASQIVRQIDPKIVIPIHYADKGVVYEVPQDDLEVFMKELGAPTEDQGAKYKIKSAANIPESLTVMVIERS